MLGTAYLYIEAAVVFHCAGNVFRFFVCDDFSFVDDDNPVADRLHLLQDVRGQDDSVLFSECTNQVADFNDLLGVQTYGRLVENDDHRIADQCLRNADALPVALGQVADYALAHVADFDDIAYLLQVLFPVQRTAFEVVVKIQIFVDRHVQVKRRLLRQIADQLFCAERVGKNVDAIDLHTP